MCRLLNNITLLLYFLWKFLLVNASKSYDPSLQFGRLKRAIRGSRGPIFEFAQDLSALIDSENGNIFELENCFYDYLSILRDYYVQDFVKRAKPCKQSDELIAAKSKSLLECNAAMKASVPKNAPPHWRYEVLFRHLE